MGTASERERLERAAEVIRGAYHRRPRLSDLAAAAGMSPFHFHRRFKRRFGETPLQMTTRHRIERAKRLLREGLGLGEIARRCGFSHHAHFSAHFKRATGMAPSRWRAAAGEESGPPNGRPTRSVE
jgi:AraC family transcriptional regulator